MRPLNLAGEISEIYMGPATDDAPTANPPRKRNSIKKEWLDVVALPKAETAYKIATTNNTNLLPYLSAGLPAVRAPIIVPINAEEIVIPCQKEFKSNNSCIDLSTPEITAVSKPKRKPPNATIKDHPNTRVSFFMP